MYTERAFPHFHLRLALLTLLMVAPLVGLAWRLWNVQVRQGPQHAQEIARQSIRRIRTAPVRGRLVAADGRVLADNAVVLDAVLHVSEMRRPGGYANTVAYILQQLQAVAHCLGRPIGITPQRVDRHLHVYPAMPLTVAPNLSRDELARLVEILPAVPGLEVVTRVRREYPLPWVASHILGFTGWQRPEEVPGQPRHSYSFLELRGRDGLERQYDQVLAGEGGTRLVRVDTLGYAHEVLGTPRPPRNGSDVVLTIDTRAQVAAERVLIGLRGALVALDANTGAVLAMASSPTYNLATLGAEQYAALAANTDARPLVNRAASAGYAPGSVIKPLIALAALAAEAITPADEVTCEGAYLIGDHPIHCWNTAGHGTVNLYSGLEQSCNCYFIEVGLRTTLDRLTPVLAAAGIGQDPGLDLPARAAETSGTLPSRLSVRRQWKRGWIPIDTAFLSIGQGGVSLSPLQAAVYTAAIGNGGRVMRPHLVQAVRNPQGAIVQNTAPTIVHRLPVEPEQLQEVREGMLRVVYGEHGAGVEAQTTATDLAGKTGTAEVVRDGVRTKNTWFVCFAPPENPRYAVAMVVEEGTSGGRTTAPLIRRFFEEWLGQPATPGAPAPDEPEGNARETHP